MTSCSSCDAINYLIVHEIWGASISKFGEAAQQGLQGPFEETSYHHSALPSLFCCFSLLSWAACRIIQQLQMLWLHLKAGKRKWGKWKRGNGILMSGPLSALSSPLLQGDFSCKPWARTGLLSYPGYKVDWQNKFLRYSFSVVWDR